MSEAEQPSWIGKVIGNYLLLEEIGRGGMATVYRARRQPYNRTVAIKVLPPYFLHDHDLYERFVREIDVVSKLEHPYILPIYDYGKVDDVPFIVMRYLSGGSLADIEGVIRPLEKVGKLLGQVAQALDHAHQHNIIHRDLKPGNILLDEEGNAYLGDFGIARVRGSELTGANVLGTPGYISPEQLEGEANFDKRADIYSLGIVLFQVITGQHPYASPTLSAMLLKQINEPIPSARALRADVPPAVDAVLTKATAKKPDERYPTAGEMASAFSEALQTMPIGAATLSRKALSGEPSTVDRPSFTAELRGGLGEETAAAGDTDRFDETMFLCLQIQDTAKPLLLRFTPERPTLVLGRRDDPELDVHADLNPFHGYELGVSRTHAEIRWDPSAKRLEVNDLGSSNGTFLNNNRLTPGQYYRLSEGDLLRLSRMLIEVSFYRVDDLNRPLP